MRRAAVLSLLLGASGACGLTARGSLASDAGETQVDSAASDSGRGGSDATVEAEVEAAPCEVTVEDAFKTTQFDPARWLVTANPANAALGFPKIVFTTTTISQAKFLEEMADNVRGAIWHTQTVPFGAFDISFDSYAVCNTGSCGDGIAIVWLEKATAAQLGDAPEGATFGEPRGLSGGAVAVDLAENAERGETEGPAVTMLDINGTDLIATPYDWVVGTSTTLTKLVNNGARRIDLSMRANVVSVKVDGVVEATGTLQHLPSEGVFGFTAASGAYNAQLAIGDVRAKFYRCNAP